MKRQVSVNGKPGSLEWKGEWEGGHFTYQHQGDDQADGAAIVGAASVVAGPDSSYSVLVNGRSWRVVLGPKGAEGQHEVLVNGRRMSVEVFDPRDLRSANRAQAREGRQNVSAPMPGKVVRVLTSVGDMVEQGQGLVVVEAMKMQNEMKSPKAGLVLEVRAQADAIVAAGDVLVVVE